MAQENIIQQGRFTSVTDTPKVLQLRSNVDWMYVRNYNNATTRVDDEGVEFYWQRGMTNGTGIKYINKLAVALGEIVLQPGVLAAPNGFYLIDSSENDPEAQVAVTVVTNAQSPVITATAHGYQTGDVVRLSAVVAQRSIMGIDFTITATDDDTLTVNTTLANTPGAGVGGAGFVRRIPFDPIWYPRNRTIADISNAQNAEINVTVPHGYSVGMEIFFNVPKPCAMVQMNGLTGTILSIVDTLTFTVDIDTTNFTAFAWPKDIVTPTNFAQCIPAGENTAVALANNGNILKDATLNTAFIGMKLPYGAAAPGGGNGDVMYWVAGKSFQVTNE